ncbi:MliC family protein [Xanthobacter autotrophicus]|uniref:MliC family protein n=1 Tax=Xanthobacter autotrophicus TaxID=280 RepID=UPI00372784FF
MQSLCPTVAVPGFALGLLLLACAPAAAKDQPSFDCRAASAEAEQIVCADAALMALDQRLARRYAAALAIVEKLDSGSKEAVATLRATQRGWISGRNDCWKAQDKPACVKQEYLRREGDLVARYILEKPNAIASFACEGNPANEVTVYFFDTQQPSVRLEYGDAIDTGALALSASGARYDASFGRLLWIKGNEATFVWEEGKDMTCRLTK